MKINMLLSTEKELKVAAKLGVLLNRSVNNWNKLLKMFVFLYGQIRLN